MTTSINLVKALLLGVFIVAVIISTIYIAYIMVPIILLVVIIGGLFAYFNSKNRARSSPVFNPDAFRY